MRKLICAIPCQFHGAERRVVLSGEAFFDVAKSDKPFIVELAGCEVKVLGTRFNVQAYEDGGRFETTLEQGSVEIKAKEKTVTFRTGRTGCINQHRRIE